MDKYIANICAIFSFWFLPFIQMNRLQFYLLLQKPSPIISHTIICILLDETNVLWAAPGQLSLPEDVW